MADLLFIIQLASTLGMFGLIWFVQLVHYPLFALVGEREFTAYEAAHVRRTGWVVIPLMLAELASTAGLLFTRPPAMPAWAAWLGAGLLAAVWASTFLVQVPLHSKLEGGANAEAKRRLAQTNWIRTVGWTARAALVCWCLHLVLGA